MFAVYLLRSVWPSVCVRLNLDVWTPSGLVYLLLLVVMLLRDLRSMVVMLELHCCIVTNVNK